MVHTLAGLPGLWSLFWVIFVIVPAIKWGLGWRPRQRRWWRVAGWDVMDDESDGRRPNRHRAMAGLQAELEQRDGDIELLNARVAELENRLDFTERLLAGHSDATALPLRPPTPDA